MTSPSAFAVLPSRFLLCLVLPAVAFAQPPGRRPTTTIQQGEACPAGTTEIRPRSCMPPDLPPPSIVDYRPRSTLVTPAHLVRRAKYPAVDFHGHPEGLLESSEGLTTLGTAMDSLNV